MKNSLIAAFLTAQMAVATGVMASQAPEVSATLFNPAIDLLKSNDTLQKARRNAYLSDIYCVNAEQINLQKYAQENGEGAALAKIYKCNAVDDKFFKQEVKQLVSVLMDFADFTQDEAQDYLKTSYLGYLQQYCDDFIDGKITLSVPPVNFNLCNAIGHKDFPYAQKL